MDMIALIDELTRDEALRLKPYRDTVGKLTIGIGHNLDDVPITETAAKQICRDDVARTLAALDVRFPWWEDMSERRQRVIVNMAFNMGVPRLAGFKDMLEALRTGDYARAAAAALDSKWAGQVGDRAKRLAAMIEEG